MMKFIFRILIVLLILPGVVAYATTESYAQYCFPIADYCSGSQRCSGDTCSVSCVNCPGGCSGGACNPTYTISGNVYVDINDNGWKDVGESNYSGASVNVWGVNIITDGSGNYSRSLLPSGTNDVILNIPNGYEVTTPPATRSITLGPSISVNYGIRLVPPPVCDPARIEADSTSLGSGESTPLTVTSCDPVEDPPDINPPPPIDWNPDDDPGDTRPNPTVNPVTPAPTCVPGSCTSTTIWTAPVCEPGDITYQPEVTVAGPGGTVQYNVPGGITVTGSYPIEVNVRSVDSADSCAVNEDNAYTNSSGTGASVQVRNTTLTTDYNPQITTTSQPGTTFICLPGGDNYEVRLGTVPGYTIVRVNNNGSQSSPGSSPVTITNLTSTRTVTFCIAPITPWFQTDVGDVRLLNLSNPVPSGQYASTGENVQNPQTSAYPGIFYSSDSAANFGTGGNASASIKQWIINNEYSYNANTENRNGGMSYEFYKSKALQDGVDIKDLTAGTLNPNQITESGVYEAVGDLDINSYTHVAGRRVVILVTGKVNINTEISVPDLGASPGQGNLFIIAAKGDITIDNLIGESDYTSTNSNLDGYYSSQGDIVIESKTANPTDLCSATAEDDLRLNVEGALIANSLKPFASSVGGGRVINNRSLCLDNLTRPALYISSRPDFLTQLTDFYKISYTKWREVNP